MASIMSMEELPNLYKIKVKVISAPRIIGPVVFPCQI